MKRILLIFLLSPAVLAYAFPPDNVTLVGSWVSETSLTELDSGLIVAAEAEYSWPYLGFREIDILDSGFIIFRMDDGEHRAFYESSQLDFDNIHLSCRFKSGEELTLKIVPVDNNTLRYLCRLPSDSELAGTLPGAEEEAAAGDTMPEMTEIPAMSEVPETSEDLSAGENIPGFIYTGVLKRKSRS